MLAVLGSTPQAARADLPMSGAALGQLEAMLEHCGRVSSAGAERYRALAKTLTGSATDKELTKARSSAEYRDARDAAKEELGGLTKEESEKACVEGLQSAGN